MRRLVIASADAKLPPAWSHAETVRGRQITAYTPPGAARRAVEWTQKIPEMQVTDCPLLDILSYHGTSLWWLIHTLVYSSTKQAILIIERCENLLQEKSPEQVLLAGMGARAKLIAQLCEREKIDCTTLRSPLSLNSEATVDGLKIALGSILLHVKEFRRRRISKSARRAGGPQNRSRVLLLSPSANWRSAWSYETDRYEKRDIFMGRIASELERQGVDVIGVDADYSLSGRLDILKDKVLDSTTRWVAFEQYMSASVKSRARADPNYAQLSQAFTLLDQSQTFKKSLEYHSVALWDFLRGRFRRALSSLHALHDAVLIEAAREMIRGERPDAIAMSYETGSYARAVIVAAWEQGIPTVGVQHGFITPTSSEYMHTRTARAPTERGCPIPAETAIGGPYSGEMLTKLSSYPPDSVAITGYTKHDDLAELRCNASKLDKGRVLAEVGLSSERKTVMIASGGFHAKYGWIPEYDREILESLLAIASGRFDLQVLVRLHPMEDGAMQRELVRKSGASVALVRGERNDLLWASDMLVAVNSAITLDALILGKPILVLDSADEDIPSADLGDAAAKYTLDTFSERVTSILDTPQFSSVARTDAESQINRHANSVDGRASFRVASLLIELIKQNKAEKH